MRHRRIARKGQAFNLSLKETAQMLLAAMCIIVVIFFAYQLIQLFVSGEKNYRAQRNFELLADRIDTINGKDLQPPESSVILQIPEGYMIAGFDAGQEAIEFPQAEGFSKFKEYFSTYMTKQQVDNVAIPRPKKCDDGQACLCLLATNPERDAHFWKATTVALNYEPVKCRELDQRTIAGTAASVQVELTGANGIIPLGHKGSMYDLVITSYTGNAGGPKNIVIRHTTSHITLATDALTGLNADGGGFGGAGSTGSWDIQKSAARQ